VRGAVAVGFGVLISKWPGLGNYIDPATQAALGGIAATIVIGIWSQLTKTDAAKISAVTDLPAVKNVVVLPSATDGVAAAVTDPAQPKVISSLKLPSATTKGDK